MNEKIEQEIISENSENELSIEEQDSTTDEVLTNDSAVENEENNDTEVLKKKKKKKIITIVIATIVACLTILFVVDYQHKVEYKKDAQELNSLLAEYGDEFTSLTVKMANNWYNYVFSYYSKFYSPNSAIESAQDEYKIIITKYKYQGNSRIIELSKKLDNLPMFTSGNKYSELNMAKLKVIVSFNSLMSLALTPENHNLSSFVEAATKQISEFSDDIKIFSVMINRLD